MTRMVPPGARHYRAVRKGVGQMQIAIRGKGIDVTNALKDHVEKKVGKIEKFFEMPLTAQVTLNVERDRHIVEVTVPVNGMYIRGEEATGDMYASIDLVVDKLEKQIEKYKTRINRKLRGTEAREPGTADFGVTGEPKVVKTKRFSVKPMPVEEAVMQINLIGHDFFVFSNADTKQVNVLYRRKDGNFGLIEPDR